MEGCGRKGIRRETPWEFLAGLTVALVCVPAASQLVIIQWEVGLRLDQRLTKGLIKSRISCI